MAFYVRTKDKDSAKKMLDELVKKYRTEIVDYDFYKDEFDLQKDKHIMIVLRNVGYKGGSLTVTIPSIVAEHMKLRERDTIGVVIDKKLNKVYLVKPISVTTSDGRQFYLTSCTT
jgi:hypothetical protein